MLYVNKSCHYGKGENGNYLRFTETPKTASPLPKQIISRLKKLRKESNSKYIISDNGQPITVRSYQRSFELLLKKLDIEKCEGEYVPVGVWYVTEQDERHLDTYEGCPSFYYKKDMKVTLKTFEGEKCKVDAFVYIMHEERPLGTPSLFYVRTCLEGYNDFGFKREHIEKAIEKSRKGV